MLAAIVNVISLKCVQHKTKPKKTTTWKIKKLNTPLFQVASCSYSKTFRYNFLNKCNQEKTKIRSTPLSCIQKKSSVYKSSRSSSFLTIGTIIGSGIKLKDSIVPLNKFAKIVKNVKKPNKELISWNDTESVAKYFNKLPILMFI
jgi:hypothetical protein